MVVATTTITTMDGTGGDDGFLLASRSYSSSRFSYSLVAGMPVCADSALCRLGTALAGWLPLRLTILPGPHLRSTPLKDPSTLSQPVTSSTKTTVIMAISKKGFNCRNRPALTNEALVTTMLLPRALPLVVAETMSTRPPRDLRQANTTRYEAVYSRMQE